MTRTKGPCTECWRELKVGDSADSVATTDVIDFAGPADEDEAGRHVIIRVDPPERP